MKNIKQFESYLYESESYWLLPTDDRFKKSLIQIKCDRDKMKEFLNNSRIRNMKYVFICYKPYSLNEWGWNPYNGKMTNDSFESDNYQFMGTVNIDLNDVEIAVNKFNL